mmetsp:Transcript_25599/g.84268  ORF Transcript_25599/g.84268 Transcript_25599/m.84268 type:complete len:342 (-) Transcript_25599:331-1356(-)
MTTSSSSPPSSALSPSADDAPSAPAMRSTDAGLQSAALASGAATTTIPLAASSCTSASSAACASGESAPGGTRHTTASADSSTCARIESTLSAANETTSASHPLSFRSALMMCMDSGGDPGSGAGSMKTTHFLSTFCSVVSAIASSARVPASVSRRSSSIETQLQFISLRTYPPSSLRMKSAVHRSGSAAKAPSRMLTLGRIARNGSMRSAWFAGDSSVVPAPAPFVAEKASTQASEAAGGVFRATCTGVRFIMRSLSSPSWIRGRKRWSTTAHPGPVKYAAHLSRKAPSVVSSDAWSFASVTRTAASSEYGVPASAGASPVHTTRNTPAPSDPRFCLSTR